jgi:hypothetical protein
MCTVHGREDDVVAERRVGSKPSYTEAVCVLVLVCVVCTYLLHRTGRTLLVTRIGSEKKKLDCGEEHGTG